ncbi:MAG TPA: tetrathionate reductase family octaheme c-type cytochrome, partial [Aliiroseovarius sp.]|nr:tetrathionate reductase family octaheme c-type cytochrome [Aliiroseovarius sp.]
RDNCGNCHFYGGGGDNVKHGDLSSVLYEPTRSVDVHMSPDGGNFTCSTCHVENEHQWAGSRYDMTIDTPAHAPGAPRTAATCESCHSDKPHKANLEGMKLNDHTDTVACQTCYIPSFARGGVATKTLWDWSTAAKLDDQGKPIAIGGYEQGAGKERHTYLSQKGTFAWGEDVTPVYAWLKGHMEYTRAGETIDPNADIGINEIQGGPDDGKIYPFKLMHGKQVIDPVNKTLAYNQAWGPTTDTALWTNFDWSKSVEAGMKAAGAPYSGEYAFAQTHMWWPTTHMVAPAAEALQCEACHAEDGRMEGLAGIYMPGTNPKSPAGLLGMLMAAATLLGVGVHMLLRLVTRRKGGQDGHA